MHADTYIPFAPPYSVTVLRRIKNRRGWKGDLPKTSNRHGLIFMMLCCAGFKVGLRTVSGELPNSPVVCQWLQSEVFPYCYLLVEVRLHFLPYLRFPVIKQEQFNNLIFTVKLWHIPSLAFKKYKWKTLKCYSWILDRSFFHITKHFFPTFTIPG